MSKKHIIWEMTETLICIPFYLENEGEICAPVGKEVRKLHSDIAPLYMPVLTINAKRERIQVDSTLKG